jgi:hypothetical protein
MKKKWQHYEEMVGEMFNSLNWFGKVTIGPLLFLLLTVVATVMLVFFKFDDDL